MSGILLGLTVKRGVSFIDGAFKKVYAHFRDQTKVFLAFERADDCPNCIPINPSQGLFKFAIGTHSEEEINVTKIEIEFPAEIQLFDPDGGNFFESTLLGRDDALPFQLTWKGHHPIGARRRVFFCCQSPFFRKYCGTQNSNQRPRSKKCPKSHWIPALGADSGALRRKKSGLYFIEYTRVRSSATPWLLNLPAISDKWRRGIEYASACCRPNRSASTTDRWHQQFAAVYPEKKARELIYV